MKRFSVGLMALFMAVTGPVRADEAELRAAIAKFAEAKKFKDTEAVIEEIAALGDPAAVTALWLSRPKREIPYRTSRSNASIWVRSTMKILRRAGNRM